MVNWKKGKESFQKAVSRETEKGERQKTDEETWGEKERI